MVADGRQPQHTPFSGGILQTAAAEPDREV